MPPPSTRQKIDKDSAPEQSHLDGMSAEDLARVQARATECHRQVHLREVDWPEHSPMWLCSGRLVERYQQHGQSPQAADAAALGAAMAFREADWPSWRRGLGAAMTCCGASHSTCERFSIGRRRCGRSSRGAGSKSRRRLLASRPSTSCESTISRASWSRRRERSGRRRSSRPGKKGATMMW